MKPFLAGSPKKLQVAKDCSVFCFNKIEANLLYKEIFEDNVYLKDGISVQDGDTIFDVGANIGFFSLYLAERYQNLKIYSFEPIPQIFELLVRNLEAHKQFAKQFNIGLSDENKKTTFHFCPNTTVLSTRHRSKLDAQHNAFKSQLLNDADPQSKDVVAKIISLFPQFLRNWAANFILRALLKSKEVPAEIRRLSDFLDEENVGHVDLLKIDTEGSELEILSGIEQQHWKRLRQIVVEVHEAEHLFPIKSLLHKNNYNINAVTQLPSKEFIVYASRHEGN